MTKIKNFFKKSGAMLTMALVGAGALLKGAFVHAAADTDLTTSLASTTSMVSDNKSIILTFIVGIGVVALVIRLAKSAVVLAIKWATSALGGSKNRGRR